MIEQFACLHKGHDYIETYTVGGTTWTNHGAILPFRCNGGRAAIPHKSEVLIAGGVVPGHGYRGEVHIFNLDTGQTSVVGNLGTGKQ